MSEIKPIANAKALIRKPVGEVFNALIEPKLLTKFWLSESQGPLQEGISVRWDFMVPGASVMTKAQIIHESMKKKS